MAELVADRTNRPELVDVAGRINVSQRDEIEFMQQWLRERGEHVPDPTAHEAMHTTHKMAGMATSGTDGRSCCVGWHGLRPTVPDIDDHAP